MEDKCKNNGVCNSAEQNKLRSDLLDNIKQLLLKKWRDGQNQNQIQQVWAKIEKDINLGNKFDINILDF
jgi:hypothetical protein